jgi:hypothetical protein
VTAEGLPLGGPGTEGNRRDSPAPRCPLTPRRQDRPALGAPRLVADSTGCAGAPRALAAAQRCRCGTWVPPTVGLRQEVGDAPARHELPLLGERPGRRHGETAPSRGASRVRPSRGKTAAGKGQELPVRLWVVEATPLATAKAPRLAAAPPPAQAPRAALDQPGQRRWFAGEAEAPHAATLCRRELATHGLDGPPRSDAERWRASKGQPAAARRGTWAKHPAVLAPSFVETPTRLAAVGGGDVSALLGSTLVERHVRKALAARGETLPDRPALSQRPTAAPCSS